MAMTINTNISSLNAQRNLNTSQSSLSTSMQRLSSGMRINSAKDDAAGLAIATRMGTQITGLNQAARNANDGVSLAQTAEGALSTIGTNLQRIRELAVQSRNATNSTEDRAALQKEVSQLTSEIDRVSKDTAFNGTNLLDGSFTKKEFQVGANQGQLISVDSIVNASSSQLGEWDSVVKEATATGGAVKAEAVPQATKTGLGTLTATGAAGWAETKITVGNGTEITIAADTTVRASDADAEKALATQIAKQLNETPGALPKELTVLVNAAADSVEFSSLSAADIEVVATGAAADVTLTAGTPAFNEIDAADFTINGIEIGVAATMSTSPTDRQNKLIEAINSKTSQTGVTAHLNGDKIGLSNKTGDIVVGVGAGAEAQLKANGFEAFDSKDSTATAFAAAEKQVGFSKVDVSTTAGADNAILAMDAALKAVNSARADLGAIQNRFESVVSNLSVNSENLSASRSRIMDADFAAETANLSRSQVLQQAGTAMVAQANQLPQGVLSLLR